MTNLIIVDSSFLDSTV